MRLLIPKSQILLPRNTTTSSQNTTTVFSSPSSNQVSWQSAMWPVIACMLLVMTQNSGRVVSVCPEYSVVLRASPLICLIDVFMTLVEFVCLLGAGCPISSAARHVWYNRYAQVSRRVPRISTGEDGDVVGDEENRREESTAEGVHDVGSNGRKTAHGNNEPIPTTSHSVEQTCNEHVDHEAPRSFRDHGVCTNVEAHIDSNAVPVCHICAANIPSSSGATSTEPSTSATPEFVGSYTDLVKPTTAYTYQHVTFYPHSSISRSWRLNISAFILGALPQIIKIASMRGIPWTQAFVSAYTLSFFVPEVLRLIAGEAGQVELSPAPLSARVENLLFTTKTIGVFLAICLSLLAYSVHIFMPLAAAINQIRNALPVAILLSLGATVGWFATVLIFRIMMWRNWNWSIHTRLLRLPHLETMGHWTKFTDAITNFSHHIFGMDIAALITPSDFSIPLFIAIACPSYMLIRYCMDTIFPVPVIVFVFKTGAGAFFVATAIITFSVLYLLYSALFVGAYSRVPRRVTGVQGTVPEFACACYMLIAVLGTVCGYAFEEWDGMGTFKPGWAENLG